MSTATTVASTAKPRTRVPRYWEVDTLRGVAIVMMVVFHLMWDLWFYRVVPDVVLWAGFWKYFQRATASLFIVLVGVSLTLSYRALVAKQGNPVGLFRRFALRGLKIFGIGVIISLGIRFSGTGYVHFGVLHLIGFSIIAAYPFLRFRWLNLALWIALVTVGYFLESTYVNSLWFVWLGLKPQFYAPVDYFPVIPWFGVVLLGIFLGNSLYSESGRRFFLPAWGAFLPFSALQFLGRHSLLIYVIHQPLLYVILIVLGIIPMTFF